MKGNIVAESKELKKYESELKTSKEDKEFEKSIQGEEDNYNIDDLLKSKSKTSLNKDVNKLKLVKIMSIPLISIFSVQIVAGIAIEGLLQSKTPKITPTYDSKEQLEFDTIMRKIGDTIESNNISRFKNEPKINKLRISDNIKHIGEEAFKDFKHIEEIIFEKDCDLKSIGYQAFSGMVGVKKITFENPNSISILNLDEFTNLANDDTAFQFGRNEDKNIVNASKADYLAMFNKATLTKAELERVSTISYNAFANNSTVKTLDLTDTRISNISRDAFKNSKIQNVLLSNNFEKIEKGIFDGLTSLRSLDTGLGVKVISDEAFKDSSISEITFGNNLLEIGESAFENTKLINVVVPESLKNLGRYAFANITTLETFILNNVETIGINIISNSKALKKLDISKAKKASIDIVSDIEVEELIINNLVNELGSDILSTFNIKKLVLEDVKSISSSLFENNTTLREVELKEGLSDIKEKAFKNVKLSKLTLPNSLKTIDSEAFANCGLEEGIDFGLSQNLFIGDKAFQNNNFTNLNISAIAEIRNDNVFEGCANIQNITMHDDVKISTTFYSRGLLASRYTLKKIFVPKSLYQNISETIWNDSLTQRDQSFDESWYSFFCLKDSTTDSYKLPYKNIDFIEYGKGVKYIKSITPEHMFNKYRVIDIKINDNIKGFSTNAFANQNINIVSDSINSKTIIGDNAFTRLGMINGKDTLITSEFKEMNLESFQKLLNSYSGKILFSNDFDFDNISTTALVANSVEFENGIETINNIKWAENFKFGLDDLYDSKPTVKKIIIPNSVKKIVNSFANFRCDNNTELAFSEGSLLETIENSFNNITNCTSLDFSKTKLHEIIGSDSFNKIKANKQTKQLNLSLPLNLLDSYDHTYFNSDTNESYEFTSLNNKDVLNLNELKNPALIKAFIQFKIKLNLSYIAEFTMTNNMLENSKFTEVVFDEGYATIPDKFLFNSEITKLTLPTTLTHIGSNAFVNTKIKDLDFRHITHLQSIGENAFGFTKYNEGWQGKYGIDTINGKAELSLSEWNAITNKKFVFGLFLGKVTASASTFENNKIPTKYFFSNLFSELILESGIRELENKAVEYMANVKHITLPNTIINYGEDGENFSTYANKILTINGKNEINANNIPRELLRAFAGKIVFSNNPPENLMLNHVTSLVFEPGVTEIPKNFGPTSFNTNELSEVVFPNTLIKIGDNAFINSRIRNLVLPSSVKSIGYFAFGSSSLENGIETINGKTELNFDDWLKPGYDVKPSAFNGFGGKVIISENALSKIPNESFYKFLFSEIEFQEGITEITKNIFNNIYPNTYFNPRLKNIILPTSLQKININLHFSPQDSFLGYFGNLKVFDTINGNSTLNYDDWFNKGVGIDTFSSFGKELVVSSALNNKFRKYDVKISFACETLRFSDDIEYISFRGKSERESAFPYLKELILPENIKQIRGNFSSKFLEKINGKTELDLDYWQTKGIINKPEEIFSVFSGFNNKVIISKNQAEALQNISDFAYFVNSKEIVFKEGIQYLPFLSISFGARREYQEQIIHIPSTLEFLEDNWLNYFYPANIFSKKFNGYDDERYTKFIIHAKDDETYNKKVDQIRKLFQICARDKSLSFLSFEHSTDLIK